MSIFIFVFIIYFSMSLLCALVRFVIDTWKYPVFCKVLKKNIKMFKRYQRQYKALIKDIEKEKKEVEKLRYQYEKKEGDTNEND